MVIRIHKRAQGLCSPQLQRELKTFYFEISFRCFNVMSCFTDTSVMGKKSKVQLIGIDY